MFIQLGSYNFTYHDLLIILFTILFYVVVTVVCETIDKMRANNKIKEYWGHIAIYPSNSELYNQDDHIIYGWESPDAIPHEDDKIIRVEVGTSCSFNDKWSENGVPWERCCELKKNTVIPRVKRISNHVPAKLLTGLDHGQILRTRIRGKIVNLVCSSFPEYSAIAPKFEDMKNFVTRV